MAEFLAVGASIVAFLQLTDRVISVCKFYIETVHDVHHDLRVILVEVSSLKATLETLSFLFHSDPEFAPDTLRNLESPNGALTACNKSLAELEKLFLVDQQHLSHHQGRVKRPRTEKISQAVAALAWPLKASKARKLLDEISRHKANIVLALSTDSRYKAPTIRTKSGLWN
jgi:hypothetical protein